MIIKIRKSNVIYILALTIIGLFSFSQMSLSNMISLRLELTMIICMTVFAFLISLLQGINNYRYFTVDEILLGLLTLVILFWNNMDLKYGNYSYEILFISLFIMIIVLKRSTPEWIPYAIKGMSLVGLFYAVMTILCFFDRDIYNKVILPLVAKYNKTIYTKNYTAGITAHFSVNAMYISISTCLMLCYFLYIKRRKIVSLLFMVLSSGGLLLTGKRGPAIFVLFAMVLTYYVYNSNRQVGRLFKAFALLISVMLIFYIAVLFVPELANFINRFIKFANYGDITNSRVLIWREAIPSFLKKPIFGNGWAWFRYNNSRGRTFHVHNCYLQWLVEVGILGSIPFFVFAGMCYYRTFRLLYESRKMITPLDSEEEFYIINSFMFQSFFLPFCFESTGFYEPEVLTPYLIWCLVSNYYWKVKKN